MASEWDICEVQDLINQQKLLIGDGYRAKNEELSGDGLPFARAGNINDGFHFGDADHFPVQNLAKVGNKVSHAGDVVFTSKGTVGRFAFVRPETPQFIYSPQLCFWRSLDANFINPRYLYFWMFGREFYVQFKGVAGQTDMAEYVSLTDQRRMHITLPTIDEQREIARILGAIDDKIELNRKMNETLEAMARALFKSWFVDFDPVRAKAEGRPTGLPEPIAALFPDSFEDSELGEIPNGWATIPVFEIADYANGAAYRDMHFSSDVDALPVVKIAELKSGVTSSTKFTSTDLGGKYRIDSREILFSWSGNPDTSIDTFIWDGGPAWLNQHIFRVRENGVWSRAKVYFQLRLLRPIFVEIARNKQTTGLGHVTIADMKRLKVCCPPRNVDEAFDRCAAPIFERITANQLENRTLAALRDTLLPKLVSGDLRVGTVGNRNLSDARLCHA